MQPFSKRHLAVCAVCVAVTCIAALSAIPRAQAARASCPWLNRALTPATRTQELLSAMTLADKLALLAGVETFTPPYDASGSGYAGYVPPNPPLCIPALTLNDGGAGVADGQVGTTGFPAPIGQAATWNRTLQIALGHALGSEAWQKGIDVLLAPDVNIARVPQNGRNFEAFGEDPFLSAQTAVSEIEGIQRNPVVAIVKHYPVNSQETNRYWVSSVVGQRVLHEIYLPPFEAAVERADVGGVMCAYGLVNGIFSCQDPELLTNVLRAEFRFDGLVVSDWGATMSGAQAANAGLDLQMPIGTFLGPALNSSIASGTLALAIVDRMAGRILRTMFRCGVFDRPPPARQGVLLADVSSPTDQLIGLAVAEQGAVLLRNQASTLPLQLSPGSSVAVIGKPAGAANQAPFVSGGGSAFVNAPNAVSPLAALQTRAARSGATVLYSDGSDMAAAASVASRASVAVVFAYDHEAEGTDRPDLDLPDEQDQLIEQVAAANPRTVVVLETGGPVLMPWLRSVASVLEAWYPGQADGQAIAALLFGDVNPSGKLPETFPSSDVSLPVASPDQWPGANAAQDAFFSEGLEVGYRWYDAKRVAPLFPFGFGLSYTRFDYTKLLVGRGAFGATVSFTVTNTGSRPGAEVAQLYVGDPPHTGEPPRRLEGYRRVSLRPAQSKRVTIALTSRAFAHWNSAGNDWQVSRGIYRIFVGSSSRNIRLRSTVSLPAETLTG